ncbi:MAG: HEPN domain-containing protein [Candidatus Bathyarchaeia archaeon]
MGTRVSFKFKRLLEERRLIRIKPDRKFVLKEIEGAESDLETARNSLKDENFKWAIVQGYYSIFYAARALLYSKGFVKRVITRF